MGTLIDSSVLVASRNDKDLLHARAIKNLRDAELPLVIHEYVLLETATVLINRASKATADIFIRAVLGNSAFSILYSTEQDFLTVVETFTSNRMKLSFTDTALLFLSGEYTVLTFDESLSRAIKRQSAQIL